MEKRLRKIKDIKLIKLTDAKTITIKKSGG